MTTDQINIAIAEACGWHVVSTEHFKLLCLPGMDTGMCCGKHLTDREVLEVGVLGNENGNYRFPSYCTDLNAMHEAVMYLKDTDRMSYLTYANKLRRIVALHNSSASNEELYEIDATARQRAEAFLRTLGKWRDD